MEDTLIKHGVNVANATTEYLEKRAALAKLLNDRNTGKIAEAVFIFKTDTAAAVSAAMGMTEQSFGIHATGWLATLKPDDGTDVVSIITKIHGIRKIEGYKLKEMRDIVMEAATRKQVYTRLCKYEAEKRLALAIKNGAPTPEPAAPKTDMDRLNAMVKLFGKFQNDGTIKLGILQTLANSINEMLERLLSSDEDKSEQETNELLSTLADILTNSEDTVDA